MNKERNANKIYAYDEHLSKFIKEIRSEGKEYLGIRRLKREIIKRHGVKYSEYKINRHLKLCGLETRTEKRKKYAKRDYSGFNIDNLLIDKETNLKNYEPTGVNELWVSWCLFNFSKKWTIWKKTKSIYDNGRIR